MKKNKEEVSEELPVVTVKGDINDVIRAIARQDGRVEKFQAQIRKKQKESLEIKREAEAEVAKLDGEVKEILILINGVLEDRKDLVELKKKYQAILESYEG